MPAITYAHHMYMHPGRVRSDTTALIAHISRACWLFIFLWPWQLKRSSSPTWQHLHMHSEGNNYILKWTALKTSKYTWDVLAVAMITSKVAEVNKMMVMLEKMKKLKWNLVCFFKHLDKMIHILFQIPAVCLERSCNCWVVISPLYFLKCSTHKYR